MNDHAMTYEYLIRRAHQCGRYGVAGADADTYRRFERLANAYFKDKNEKKLIEYMTNAGAVSAFINSATNLVRKKYDTKLTDEQFNELEGIEVLLISPNKDKIIEAISRAEKVMLEIGLYPQ